MPHHTSIHGLTAPDEAMQQMLCKATPLAEQESIATMDARGRVCAQDIISPMAVPTADNSAMDGYALALADLENSTTLTVQQRIAAGACGEPLTTRCAARIFTGAPIPERADAVVMQEHCQRSGNQVHIQRPVQLGQNIRRAGEDIQIGEILVAAGQRLLAPQLGLLASIGLDHITVNRRLRVALICTGDELQEPGTTLQPGHIYNANRYTLTPLLHQLGCTVIDPGSIADRLSDTQNALREAAGQADLIISCGGVSAGEEDHVSHAVRTLGQLHWWKLAIKPGKPLCFGQIGAAHFIGLPGNPVSAFITFLLYARPFILQRQGDTQIHACPIRVRAGFDQHRTRGRAEYLRARLETDRDGQRHAVLYPQQGSGILRSLAWADGLVCLPPECCVQSGQWVSYLSFSALGVT